MNSIVMKHFYSSFFQRSGRANKHHIYQPRACYTQTKYGTITMLKIPYATLKLFSLVNLFFIVWYSFFWRCATFVQLQFISSCPAVSLWIILHLFALRFIMFKSNESLLRLFKRYNKIKTSKKDVRMKGDESCL